MKIISVYMQAGGVGKTSITSMLAFELAKKGKALIIDADQQGNTTLQFLEEYGTVSYIFKNQKLIEQCCVKNDIEPDDVIKEVELIKDYCYENEIEIKEFFENSNILDDYCEKNNKNSSVLLELYKIIVKFASKNCKDFLSVLKQDSELEDAVIRVREESTDFKGLYILPTKNTDTKLQNFYESVDFREEPEIVENILKNAEELNFEYVFFDLPPTFGYAQKILLSNCTDIIPIINPDEKSISGLIQFNEHMEKLKKQYKGKFIANNYLIVNREKKDNKVHQHWINVLKESPYKLFEFSDSNTITSAASQKLVLQEWQKSSKLCLTIQKLSEEITREE